MADINSADIENLRRSLNSLIGVQFNVLKIPREVLVAFEPSQVGSLVGVLMDACMPHLDKILPSNQALENVGLSKHEGILGEREGYPDFLHDSGKRLELKLLYIDPIDLEMKSPPTPREPSARLTQKVTVKNVDPANDVLMVVAYQLQPYKDERDVYSPTIVDLGLFPMIECIRARDKRLEMAPGRWFGDYETPAIMSKIGKTKQLQGLPVDDSSYGRKESEGHDYNEDTNFGKLKRIPYLPLQQFLKEHVANKPN